MLDISSLASMLGVPQARLLALAPANDPLALHQPARRRGAEWFAEVWGKFRFGSGIHIRRIHYRFVSAEEPILRPGGEPYLNTTTCWQALVNASRDARYLKLVPEGAFVDRRSPEPLVYFGAVAHGEAFVSNTGLAHETIDDDFPSCRIFGSVAPSTVRRRLSRSGAKKRP